MLSRPVKERLALAAYGVALRLLAPFYLLRLWRRGGVEPLYRADIKGRFGLGPPVPTDTVWVHAVSLGETRAAAPLIAALRHAMPGMRLLLTHGTATGRAAGAGLLQPGDLQAWLPYDAPEPVHHFLRRHQPRIGLLMETEIWPRLLHDARLHGVPMVLANARLSERSLRKGERFAALLGPAARGLAVALAQTRGDAERLQAAGVPRVEVCGNLKYDVTPAPAQLQAGAGWKALAGRAVVVAANTRDGEEAPLLAAWVASPAPRPVLLIGPRHPQRFADVRAAIVEAGLSVVARSERPDGFVAADAAADVWLGDSVGEMPAYYAAADVAILGGSFEPLGGHNLIEAAACGCPIVLGPSTFNFADAAELAVDAGAAWRVADLPAAVARARQVVDTDEARQAGERAAAFSAQHRGAADRTVAAVQRLLAGPAG